MVRKTTKTPANGSAKKTPSKKRPARKEVKPSAKPAEAAATPEMVQPLSRDAFNMVMGVIENASFLGKDIEKVARLKLELAVVAGLARLAPTSDGG